MPNIEKRPYSSPTFSPAPQTQTMRKWLKETLAASDIKAEQEAGKRHITKDQWSDLLGLSKMTNQEQDWLGQTFSFPGGGRIRIKDTLDLTRHHSLAILPKGLEGSSIFLSSQLNARTKDKFKRAKQRGDIKCTIIYF